MKAVNLIPSEERGGGAGGFSGGAVYVVLGALAVLVVMVAALALTSKSVHDKRADLASINAKAQSAQAEANSLKGYTAFKSLRQTRTQTVQSIAASRFDWSHALHEVSRTIPSNVMLQSLTASVAPGSASGGGSGASSGGSGVRGAINAPAFEMSGCTTGQKQVANLMSAMRQVDGVTRVSLEQSTRQAGGASGGAAPSASSGTAAGGCGGNPANFGLVVFFAPQQGASTTPTTTGATP